MLSTYNNGGLGIDRLSAGTPDLPYPTITGFAFDGGGILLVSGLAEPDAMVELYRAEPDPSGHGEGKTYSGSVVADASGSWQIPATGGGGTFTAFQTKLVGLSSWDSSEYGPNASYSYTSLFLPITLK